MRCSHCGICCHKTEMLLSKRDIKLLEKAGYLKKNFVQYNRKCFARLRNKKGYCFFYDIPKNRCKVYRLRPLGCRIYPVIYSDEEGLVLDDLCSQKNTVSKKEIMISGKKLLKLLKKIDEEAKNRGLQP